MTDRKKIIKNKPKNINQIVNDNIEPYLKERGKPIYPSTNRANEISMHGEKEVDLTVGIEDINEAVMFYFNDVIKPYVIENGTKLNVPVIYANPERFKASQIDGTIRDKQGKVLLPVITLTRTNIDKVRTLGNKLDGNKVHNYAIYEKRFSTKNHYDNFAILNNRIPVKEYHTVVIPDYYKMRYECSIYVNFVQDLDRIIEAIGQYSYSYWGREGKFKFMAAIDSFDSRTEILVGSDRVILCNFGMTLNGYVTPRDINKHLASTNKFLSKAQLIFTAEVDNNIEILNTRMKQPSTQANFNIFPEKIIVTSPSAQLDVQTLNYIRTSITKTASSVNSDSTIEFNNTSILNPPNGSGLPATTKNDFMFFINGQYLEQTAIVSFDQVGTSCILTINPSELGYLLTDLQSPEIIAIGKFQ